MPSPSDETHLPSGSQRVTGHLLGAGMVLETEDQVLGEGFLEGETDTDKGKYKQWIARPTERTLEWGRGQ